MRILHALLPLLKHYLLIFQLFLSLPSLVLGQASSTSWLTSSIPQTQHSLNLIPLKTLLGQFMVLGLSYTDRFNLWTEGGNISSFQFCLMMEVSSIPQIVFPEDALRSHFRQQQTSQTLITNKTSLAPLTNIFHPFSCFSIYNHISKYKVCELFLIQIFQEYPVKLLHLPVFLYLTADSDDWVSWDLPLLIS